MVTPREQKKGGCLAKTYHHNSATLNLKCLPIFFERLRWFHNNKLNIEVSKNKNNTPLSYNNEMNGAGYRLRKHENLKKTHTDETTFFIYKIETVL